MNAGGPKADPEVVSELSKKYVELQERIEQATQAQAKLAAQETECKIVKEELDNLESDAQIYKMIGACLVKEDHDQAKDNLNARLQYIKKELESHSKNSAKNKEELDKLVQQIQKYQS